VKAKACYSLFSVIILWDVSPNVDLVFFHVMKDCLVFLDSLLCTWS